MSPVPSPLSPSHHRPKGRRCPWFPLLYPLRTTCPKEGDVPGSLSFIPFVPPAQRKAMSSVPSPLSPSYHRPKGRRCPRFPLLYRSWSSVLSALETQSLTTVLHRGCPILSDSDKM
ncbi:hypothetical protein SUGI_0851590 [Cryptomeria japonica]|nr:hypothetical protein SUGI_0851590 [Cryptomeria japonica]